MTPYEELSVIMCNEILATRREKVYLCNREGNKSLHCPDK